MRSPRDHVEPTSGSSVERRKIISATIGDVVVIPVLDSYLELDAHEAAIGVPLSALSAESPGLVDGHGHVRFPVICHVVCTQGSLVLVDTGIGQRLRPGWPPGRLDCGLREVGVDPRDIEIVVNTHMHADHVGWNTIGDGAATPFFPNARYLFQQLEWDHWIAGGLATATGNEHLLECVASLAASAHVELVAGDVAVTPELTLVATPGHTPGHVAVGITSAGQRALIVGDVTHYPAQLVHPDWSPAWDLDPVQAARTREDVFRSIEDDPLASLITSHWPYPGLGRIVRIEGRRQFRGIDRPSRAVGPDPG